MLQYQDISINQSRVTKIATRILLYCLYGTGTAVLRILRCLMSVKNVPFIAPPVRSTVFAAADCPINFNHWYGTGTVAYVGTARQYRTSSSQEPGCLGSHKICFVLQLQYSFLCPITRCERSKHFSRPLIHSKTDINLLLIS